MPTITRRGLLIGAGVAGGGLLLGSVGIATYVTAYDQRRLQAGALAQGSKLVTQWISVSPDNAVTLHGPHTEMGQGTQTSLLQILLEELDADPEHTRYRLAPADPAFAITEMVEGALAELAGFEAKGWTEHFVRDAMGRSAQLAGVQFTGGSMAIRFTGWVGIRRAAASARAMLAQAGAEALGVPVSEVRTENSHVHHDASGRSVPYGELADRAAALELPEAPPFKKREDYRFVGKPFPRFDLPEKVFGDPVYGMDEAVEGMRYAAVAPPPLAQGRVTGVTNRDEVEQRRGVEAVVVMDDAVAVVADNPWRAEQAVRALQITCDPPEGGPLDHVSDEAARLAALAEVSEVISVGETVGELSGDDVVEATYVTPYYVHVPMEPMNATVWEQDGKHHVATGTQGPLNTRYIAAKALGRPWQDVILHARTMGGGFGRRNALVAASINWVRQACHIQQAVGGAVKLIWSREAGVRMSTYHPADAARLRARLGPDGKPVDWRSDVYAPVMASTEVLPAYAGVPNRSTYSASGSPALPFGYWRSVAAFTTTYFFECFVDELAEKAGVDPLAYRLSLLEEGGREARTLTTAAERAGYTARVVGDRGFGIAFASAFGSLAAAVAEVSLDGDTPVVHRISCAIDCGTPVNPGSVEAQAQGGLYWGVSAALYGKVEFEEGRMVQSNFHNYRVATFRDAPRVDVDVLVSPDATIGGVGELSTPLAAPAIANALAALTERRRTLPLIG